jgi:hypothetical protein
MFSAARMALGAPQWGPVGKVWSGGKINLNVNNYASLGGGGFLPAYTYPVTTGNSSLATMSTPYGSGFSFTVSDSEVAIWDSTAKAVLLQGTSIAGNGRSDPPGTIVQYTAWINVPSQSFGTGPDVDSGWFLGVLWELHTQANQAHGLSVDTNNTDPHYPTPAWRWDVQYDSGGNNVHSYYGPVITYDTWHRIDAQMYWTQTANGFQRFYVDGVLCGSYTGRTYWTAFGNPYMQFGFYSGIGGVTNYSQFGPTTRQIFATYPEPSVNLSGQGKLKATTTHSP